MRIGQDMDTATRILRSVPENEVIKHCVKLLKDQKPLELEKESKRSLSITIAILRDTRSQGGDQEEAGELWHTNCEQLLTHDCYVQERGRDEVSM